jgi:hypothetical protein
MPMAGFPAQLWGVPLSLPGAADGRAYSLILGAELKRLEHRLAALDADPASPLGAIAPAFRRVHDFRAHLAELKRLLSALDDRAREVRTSRLLASPRGQ